MNIEMKLCYGNIRKRDSIIWANFHIQWTFYVFEHWSRCKSDNTCRVFTNFRFWISLTFPQLFPYFFINFQILFFEPSPCTSIGIGGAVGSAVIFQNYWILEWSNLPDFSRISKFPNFFRVSLTFRSSRQPDMVLSSSIYHPKNWMIRFVSYIETIFSVITKNELAFSTLSLSTNGRTN